jgi:hypothetical protein
MGRIETGQCRGPYGFVTLMKVERQNAARKTVTLPKLEAFALAALPVQWLGGVPRERTLSSG